MSSLVGGERLKATDGWDYIFKKQLNGRRYCYYCEAVQGDLVRCFDSKGCSLHGLRITEIFPLEPTAAAVAPETVPSTDPGILELQARVVELEEEQTELVNSYHLVIKAITGRLEKLEAQADHSPGATKMVPVATVTRDRDETGNYAIVHDTATPPQRL